MVIDSVPTRHLHKRTDDLCGILLFNAHMQTTDVW